MTAYDYVKSIKNDQAAILLYVRYLEHATFVVSKPAIYGSLNYDQQVEARALLHSANSLIETAYDWINDKTEELDKIRESLGGDLTLGPTAELLLMFETSTTEKESFVEPLQTVKQLLRQYQSEPL